MKIKTLLKDEFGKKRPTGLGSIEFDENGIAEVDPQVAKRLCAISKTIEVVEPENKTLTKGDVDSQSIDSSEVDDVDSQSIDSSEVDELSVLREVLSEKTIVDLRDLCEEAGVEGYEEFKGPHGKKKLVDFMVSKKVGL